LRGRLFKTLEVLLLAGVAGYAGVMLLVWGFQERLLFYPRAVSSPPAPPAGWRLEPVSIKAADGALLAGVLVLPPVPRPPLVIYFGGNAEEVTSFASLAAQSYGNRAVLLVNYRGYGDSTGAPGEKSLVSDGIEIFDWASRRTDIDAGRIAIHGRSLGGGVSVQVAAARPPRCVILTSPFDSALAVGQRHYWWLPIAWLIRHPFDSAARAPGLKMPALFLIGDADTLIPASHSKRLASLWGGPAEQLVLPGYGHNDLSLDPRYDAAIHTFLDRNL